MRAEEGDESIAELADYAEQAEQNLDESIAPLEGKKVAILATNGVERRELQEPRDAVQAAGASTELVSLQEGSIDMRDNDLNPGGTEPVARLVADITPDDFDALLIPGGTVNADKLRADDEAVKFVRDFVQSGKPVGVICHGPWTLIDAGVAKGRTLTSFPSLRIDLQNAGATVVDREVVIDGNLISSRGPDDLPAFSSAVVNALARGA
ncbi:type 1 glutamine amidotransferase [Mycolicibacterium mucogenicum]|uniref:type 1 glutamine amidotransferase domain-containing protein n=1 Tax=Mycolicibacterium mucogenicum TaxID=56689 RepID=UPI00226AB3A5|nr:type 1 glutamine amidotransferase domain-containing protein [Mycolicibacterium mucogenicum]MCX8561970.1 type 1 glutamine amidotransferase [Mycolicibacterium mucogenicum]